MTGVTLAEEGVTITPGSIGASSREVSLEILGSDQILEDAMFRLQGLARVNQPDGSIKIIELKERKYNPECIGWMRGKLQEILNKNMYLSNLEDNEMYREAKEMAINFDIELWINWKHLLSSDNDVAVAQYEELCNMYSNYLMAAVHLPLYEGIRKLLKETHSESTQKLTQTVNETAEKRGIIGGLLGGK